MYKNNNEKIHIHIKIKICNTMLFDKKLFQEILQIQ